MIDYRVPLNELPDPLPIVPLTKPFDVSITPPGSKSITNRAYVLAALAEGASKIIRPLRSEDTDALLSALCALGAEAWWEGEDVFIKGVAGRFPRGGEVNLGDGGTPTRFMIAAACLAAEPVIVDGSARMRERPIAQGVEMLRQLGARIEYVEEEGRLPVRVVPSDEFKGGVLTIGKTASSQFISAVMLVAPWLREGVCIKVHDDLTSRAYITLTIDVLDRWGVAVNDTLHYVLQDGTPIEEMDDDGFALSEQQNRCIGDLHVPRSALAGRQCEVEPDASSAVYWWAAGAVMPSSMVQIPGLDLRSVQPDACFTSLIYGASRDGYDGLRQRLQATISAEDMPDASIALAIVASVAMSEPLTITGLHTLRVKETDRIAALANELRKVGCEVETTDDSITITPLPRDRLAAEPGANGVVIETYNDHRMAMAFAVLGLVRPGIAIANPKCVAKSYPTFWRDFAKLYE